MNETFVVPIVCYGHVEEENLGGYYCYPFDEDMSAFFLTSFVVGKFDNSRVGHANNLEEVGQACQMFSSRAGSSTYVYIIPYRKDELLPNVKERLFNSDKVVKKGFYKAGKITWLGERTPLDTRYAVPVEEVALMPDWKTMLRTSSVLRMMTELDSFPITRRREIVYGDIISEKIVPVLDEIYYKKRKSEETVLIARNKFESKVAKNRGIPRFEYTNNVKYPRLLKEFVEGKLSKESEAAQKLASGYKISSEVSVLTDENVRCNALEVQACTYIQRVLAIDGFGVFAKVRLISGSFIGIYAGKFTDTVSLFPAAEKYSYIIPAKDGITWSKIQAMSAYDCGNFTGFINHASGSKANITALAANYNGLIFAVYVAKKEILPGAQLFVDNSTIFSNGDKPLLLTDSGEVIQDELAHALGKKVNSEGVAFFKKNEKDEDEKAKRKFKQAVALSSDVGCRYSLGSAYLRLAVGDKEKKYLNRARFFLTEASKNVDYKAKAEPKLQDIQKRMEK
jgi:hypothetical protein